MTNSTRCKECPRSVIDIDLPERSLAFLLYIMRVTYGCNVPLEDIIFAPVKQKFGLAEARWATVFYADESELLEFWIIYKDDEPTAVATRMISGGDIDTGFAQLVINPISDGVKDLIKNLPPVTTAITSSGKMH